jgi:hypothetical protein
MSEFDNVTTIQSSDDITTARVVIMFSCSFTHMKCQSGGERPVPVPCRDRRILGRPGDEC